MAHAGLTVAELRQALQAANMGAPVGELLAGNRAVAIEAGAFLHDAREVGELIVGVRGGKPVYLQDVATVREGAPPARQYVWHGTGGPEPAEYPAVTIQISKKAGENAIEVSNGVLDRVEELRNTLIPQGVEIVPSRNYGITANDKAVALIQKLLFATACVVALVFVTLGRREAAIVGVAVALDARGYAVRLLGLGVHAQPGVAVRLDLLDRHPGRRRHRRGGKHPSAAPAASRKIARTVDSPGRGRGRRADGVGHPDRDRGPVADGLSQRPDRALHEPDSDQRQHGHAAVAGHRVQRHTLAGALVDEAGCASRPRRRQQAGRWARPPVRACVHALARCTSGFAPDAACWPLAWQC